MPDDSNIQKKVEPISPEQPSEAVERPTAPEKGAEAKVEQAPEQEKAAEQEKEKIIKTQEQIEQGTAGIATAGTAARQKEEREKKIEEIMSEDLADIYVTMPPNTQQEFKQKGEETAREINSLLDKAKLKVRKVLKLLKKWLAIVPGINKFFLEQEAKIKTDEIVKLKDEKLYK